jgi:hypothetical protein
LLIYIACELIDSDGTILKKIIKVINKLFLLASSEIFKGGDMLEELYLSGNQLSTITCKNIGVVLSE